MALIGTISGSIGAGGSKSINTAITGTVVVANKPPATFPSIPSDAILYADGNAVVTGDIVASGTFKSWNSIGAEGGELFLSKAATGTVLTTGVTIDVYNDKLRIFETGGTNRGGYFDISTLATGVGTNLAASGGPSPLSTFTTVVGSPFTLVIPVNCDFIEIEACGGGGGGGSGRRGVAANGVYGGGGGAGGGYSTVRLSAPLVRALSSSLTITIGASGSGGSAVTADDTNGNPGGGGSATTVAAGVTTLLYAPPGNGGPGGTLTSGLGALSTSWKDSGGSGANSSNTAKPGKPAVAGFAGGGGAGAGVTTAGAALDGGDGGAGGDIRVDNVSRAGGGGAAATPRNGGNANTSSTYSPTGGGGGGGGASRAGGGAAGSGGAGIQGGGGGGGGGNINGAGNDSGKGGDGGVGWCIVRFS